MRNASQVPPTSRFSTQRISTQHKTFEVELNWDTSALSWTLLVRLTWRDIVRYRYAHATLLL
jgi:hypothetical protein